MSEKKKEPDTGHGHPVGMYAKLIDCGFVEAARKKLDPEQFAAFEQQFKGIAQKFDGLIGTIETMDLDDKEELLKQMMIQRGIKHEQK